MAQSFHGFLVGGGGGGLLYCCHPYGAACSNERSPLDSCEEGVVDVDVYMWPAQMMSTARLAADVCCVFPGSAGGVGGQLGVFCVLMVGSNWWRFAAREI